MGLVATLHRALNERAVPSTSSDVAGGFGVKFSPNSVSAKEERALLLEAAIAAKSPALSAAKLMRRGGQYAPSQWPYVIRQTRM